MTDTMREMPKNRFETLGSIVDVINSTLDISRILEMIMDNAMELMGAERGFIMLIDPRTEELNFKIARNIDRNTLKSDELEISRSIVHDVFREQKGILTHNAVQDPRYRNNPSVRAFGLRSVICVPLMVKGSCVGVIYLDNRFKLGIFSEDDLEFMKIFAHEIALAMDNARLEEEKAIIKELFKQYVSPEVADEILSRGEELNLRGEKRVVTVFFVDIRGFTTLSEKYPPRELINQFNEFAREMVDILFRHRGTLLKYLGDGLMAAFGAPLEEQNDAMRAVMAALEMQKRMELVNRSWEEQGKPPFRIGIGMNTGEALVGTVGCLERCEYTVIGDVCNTASRLEGLTKEYGCSFIISEATYACVRDHCSAQCLGTVAIRGKEEPVTIYKVDVK
jgi:adenylate cyclase